MSQNPKELLRKHISKMPLIGKIFYYLWIYRIWTESRTDVKDMYCVCVRINHYNPLLWVIILITIIPVGAIIGITQASKDTFTGLFKTDKWI